MIELQQYKDRKRFERPNLERSLQTELDAEDQRVALGLVPTVRRSRIEQLFYWLAVRPDKNNGKNTVKPD